MPHLHSARYTPSYAQPSAFPTSTPTAMPQPSRLDKLQQLDSMDRNDEQGDALRQSGQLQNQAGLMHMLSTLYDIQHEQEMAPEQLNALRSSSAARDFETQNAQQMAPVRLEELQNKNVAERFKNQNAPSMTAAELAHVQAETDRLQHSAKFDVPDIHFLSTEHALGHIPDPDYYTALENTIPYHDMGVAGNKRISDAAVLRAQARDANQTTQGRPAPSPSPLSHLAPAQVFPGTGVFSESSENPYSMSMNPLAKIVGSLGSTTGNIFRYMFPQGPSDQSFQNH